MPRSRRARSTRSGDKACSACLKGQYDCVREFSEFDYTDDLKKIDKPTLVLHGADHQIVPIADSGGLSAKIVKGAVLKVIPGGAHGMCTTQADAVNDALLEFLKG